MTEYTPEKVAELIETARTVVERNGVKQSTLLIDRLTDALEATVKERDMHLAARLRAVDYRAVVEDIRTLLDTPTDERGVTWWVWIEDGLGGSLHDDLRRILSRITDKEQSND